MCIVLGSLIMDDGLTAVINFKQVMNLNIFDVFNNYSLLETFLHYT